MSCIGSCHTHAYVVYVDAYAHDAYATHAYIPHAYTHVTYTHTYVPHVYAHAYATHAYIAHATYAIVACHSRIPPSRHICSCLLSLVACYMLLMHMLHAGDGGPLIALFVVGCVSIFSFFWCSYYTTTDSHIFMYHLMIFITEI